jgi:DNA-binding transcriptional ArsR family regulator
LDDTNGLDDVWKALADSTRRQILDLLRNGPRRTTEIVDAFPQMTRFGVMKHLDVLRAAGLVITRAEGRERYNALNPMPIRQIYDRWVSKYADMWAVTFLRVKDAAESKPDEPPPT